MGDFEPSFVRSLARQSWSMYGIGMFLLLLRIYARIHRLRFKGLQKDDYLMMLAGAFYTALIVCLNVISEGGGSNLYEPEDFPTFTPKEVQDRIKGSKIVLVSEQAMLNIIYTIKVCLLIMYSRLTLGLATQKMVTYLAYYVAVGWVATEIAFSSACRPFKGYWAMPPPNTQCTTLERYAIVQACFNISSDALMICPIPLLVRLHVPLKQKAVLMVIFSIGIFVILAAILTKVFNLSDVWDPSYMLWYTRESSVVVYVSNLPMIWPLLREWFPVLRSLTPGQKSSGPSGKRPCGANSTKPTVASMGRPTRLSSGDGKIHEITTTVYGNSESEEDLSGGDSTELRTLSDKGSWEGARHERDFTSKGVIHTTTVVQVSEERIDGASLSNLQSTRVYPFEDRDIEKGRPPNHGFQW